VTKQVSDGFEFRILLWDNASQDRTIEVAQKAFLNSSVDFSIVRETSNTYLKGSQFFYDAMRACEGDYIAVIDGDDEWQSEIKLKNQFEYMEKNNSIELCGTLAEQYNVATCEVDYLIPHQNQVGIHDGDYLSNDNIITNSTVFFRKTLVNRLPKNMMPFPIKDLPVWALGLEGFKFTILPDISTRYYFNHGHNVSLRKSTTDRFCDVVETYSLIVKCLKSEEYKKAWLNGLLELLLREKARTTGALTLES
jgi:glycosyltransferase involved in cell wall biosynthesis